MLEKNSSNQVNQHAAVALGSLDVRVNNKTIIIEADKELIRWTDLRYAYNESFEPRPDIWSKLSEYSKEKKAVSYKVLVGFGGVGKSSILSQWAHEEERTKNYTFIFWMPMEKASSSQSLEALAKVLEINTKNREPSIWLNEIKNTLNSQSWLVIWDNVEDYDSIAEFLPYFQSTESMQHLLMTSRDDNWDSQHRINVDVYTLAESLAYIERQMKAAGLLKFDEKQATELSNYLGYHPLALELVMANICSKKLTLEKYLEKLKNSSISSEPWPEKKLSYQARLNNNTLATLWDFESENLSPDALMILKFTSFLNPDVIQGDLLVCFLDEDEERYDNALPLLWNPSFIKRHENVSGKEWYSIHRLLQDVVREKTLGNLQDKNNLKTLLQKGLQALYTTFFIRAKKSSDMTRLRQGVLHGNQWLKYIDNLSIYLDEPSFTLRWYIGLLTTIGERERVLADYENAKLHLGKVFAFYKTAPDIVNIGEILHSLSMLYYAEGDYSKARDYALKSLEISRVPYRENTDHPDIAAELNNIAMIYYSEGKYSKAQKYYKESLEMKGRCYEDQNHPDIATTLHNLSMVYYRTSNYLKALDYCKKALNMRCAFYGPELNHSEIADTLNNLGMIYCSLNQPEEALECSKQALWMRYSIYGEKANHSDISDTLNNLGMIYCDMKQHNQALEHFRQALEIRHMIHGKNANHPRIVRILRNLRVIHSLLGNIDEEERYELQENNMERAIAEKAIYYRENHNTLNNLSKEAEAFYQKELSERIQRYEGGDIVVAAIQQNLVTIFEKLKRSPEAKALYREALPMLIQFYDEESAYAVTTKFNLAETQGSLERHAAKAEVLYQSILPTMMKLFGAEDLNVAETQFALSHCQMIQGKFSLALSLIETCTDVFKKQKNGNIYLESCYKVKQYLLNALSDSRDSDTLSQSALFSQYNTDKPDQMLRRAAAEGHRNNLILLLNRHPELINAIDSNPSKGWTALHWAVQKSHASCVIALLRRNARYDIPDKKTQALTAVDICLATSNKAIKEIFFNHITKKYLKNNGHESDKALRIAANFGDLFAVKLLIASNVDINAAGPKTGKTALHQATIKKHIAVIQYLIDVDADVNIIDFSGKIAVDYAKDDKTLLSQFSMFLMNKGKSLYWAEQGKLPYNAEKLRNILKNFDVVLAQNAKNEEALLYKAKILSCLGAEGKALATLDRLLEINGPLAIYADGSQGMILYKIGQYSDALYSFDKVLAYCNLDEHPQIKADAEKYKRVIFTKQRTEEIMNDNEVHLKLER